MSYFTELSAAMKLLATQPNAIFMGQGVTEAGGTTMSATLDGIDAHQRLELPVAEDMQMGMAVGMALMGFLPICIFPRWDFLLLAANQLVLHLDRLPLYSAGGFRPKVIIRTAIPSTSPFNPGPQHDDDCTEAFRSMCRTVLIKKLPQVNMIMPYYKEALVSPASYVLVEFTEHYKDERGKSS